MLDPITVDTRECLTEALGAAQSAYQSLRDQGLAADALRLIATAVESIELALWSAPE